ncbi:LTA synthase family protein [Clostridium botulinum]|uniref:LTA synthase family protein n=1 Tax=Clostridium botulinum TaxID=1491 RepID=A0A6B4PKM5_CLOBO|nr:LTA synthase family protein [Clostridium botulinum]NFE59421.1 LTA synthase family protein [Clostridium botulinum]NFE74546.1 LTA synthase family protein [Clostridium botulinum]NFE94790.1 LTA synthase family protein [Clostridium botulinum]NFF88959.1 LTA synthase family protein [Clostridium botulinum]NFG11417.1 LTA synthase family protein [Clostridium botulinum]
MKKNLKRIIKNNWLFVFMVIMLQLKSMILLSMLRAPNSSSINLSNAYFTPPIIWAHLSIIILVCSPIFLFKNKDKLKAALVIDIFITILFIADIWYYRANGTFLSIRHLIHNELFNPIGKNLFNFRLVDLTFFIDFIILFLIYKFVKVKKEENEKKIYLRIIKSVSVFLISAFIIGIGHYYVDIKKSVSGKSLFSLSWAPFQTFSDMSPLGYHGFDINFYKDKNKALTSDDINVIENWFDNNKENLPDNKYKGMLEGKNLIALQVESLENFVINEKVYGQEITPNINKLLSNSIYFNNIYEQNNSGTSSDADLLVNTSIFPIRKGATVFSYPWNKYNSLQSLLKNKGYTSISTHAALAGNWNWAELHRSFGADKIFDIGMYTEDELIGLGLSDESYLKQISEKLKIESEPFYTFMATLTSHGPFEMPDDKKYLDLPKELDENMLGAYFQSVRYTDEAIGKFLDALEKNNQLNNTVVMIYGDHCGIHKFYEEDIADAPLEGDWWQDNNKKIPFIVYSKDLKTKIISNAGGQVDFLPTISYLLGIDRSDFEFSSMGRILVNTERDATILNSGDIVGNPKDEDEINHLKDVFKIADTIIEKNYFKSLKFTLE